MSLLDGALQAMFGAAFGPLLLDGTLHVAAKDAEGGMILPPVFVDVPVKGHRDELGDRQRADWGIPDRAVRLVVLQANVAAEPTPDDEITLAGGRWRIGTVERDPAGAAWILTGMPA
ncbi:hypothetical protein [Inquilinus limosus]|uniref:Uncharacterized protein n=1 Tax=Inquilinus limosus MP06 TaxID=1398085 RepID=A0A0A0D8F9_9PROT|nr:hypothetical protein [Inquilinus limosus]KGM34991.1 hypothetical protein P409_07025 [Inquilinus limosus MP06]